MSIYILLLSSLKASSCIWDTNIKNSCFKGLKFFFEVVKSKTAMKLANSPDDL